MLVSFPQFFCISYPGLKCTRMNWQVSWGSHNIALVGCFPKKGKSCAKCFTIKTIVSSRASVASEVIRPCRNPGFCSGPMRSRVFWKTGDKLPSSIIAKALKCVLDPTMRESLLSPVVKLRSNLD